MGWHGSKPDDGGLFAAFRILSGVERRMGNGDYLRMND